jgi:hypothetical protein
MTLRFLPLAALAVLAATPIGAEEPRGTGTDCAAVIRAKVAASNAEEVCALLLTQAAPGTGGNLDGVYDYETRDLGDGETVHVFRFKTSGDPLAVQPNYHFVARGGALVLAFDGQGSPARYATERTKVNGKWQIERVVEANVPGLYRKREVETWFWSPDDGAYRRAFTRVTIAGASQASLNGTKMHWNPETEEAYRSAGTSWTHTVSAGDTLGAIARRKGIPAAEIARQNGISASSTLRIGQKLRYDSWKVNVR